MQLRTTMNVATPEWLDYIHIGLQFQIEHHLFPRLPRHNLRKARAKVRAICKKYVLAWLFPPGLGLFVSAWGSPVLRIALHPPRASIR